MIDVSYKTISTGRGVASDSGAQATDSLQCCQGRSGQGGFDHAQRSQILEGAEEQGIKAEEASGGSGFRCCAKDGAAAGQASLSR